MTVSMKRTRSLPMLSSVYRPGVRVLRPWPSQIHGEHLEVLGQPGHGGFVAPPRLGLPGDEQQRR
jgi:hypothetical protein